MENNLVIIYLKALGLSLIVYGLLVGIHELLNKRSLKFKFNYVEQFFDFITSRISDTDRVLDVIDNSKIEYYYELFVMIDKKVSLNIKNAKALIYLKVYNSNDCFTIDFYSSLDDLNNETNIIFKYNEENEPFLSFPNSNNSLEENMKLLDKYCKKILKIMKRYPLNIHLVKISKNEE